nr:hypothetical protein [uncultured Azospirillum sp.]
MVEHTDLTEEQADQIIDAVLLQYPDAKPEKSRQGDNLWTVNYQVPEVPPGA